MKEKSLRSRSVGGKRGGVDVCGELQSVVERFESGECVLSGEFWESSSVVEVLVVELRFLSESGSVWRGQR